MLWVSRPLFRARSTHVLLSTTLRYAGGRGAGCDGCCMLHVDFEIIIVHLDGIHNSSHLPSTVSALTRVARLESHSHLFLLQWIHAKADAGQPTFTASSHGNVGRDLAFPAPTYLLPQTTHSSVMLRPSTMPLSTMTSKNCT